MSIPLSKIFLLTAALIFAPSFASAQEEEQSEEETTVEPEPKAQSNSKPKPDCSDYLPPEVRADAQKLALRGVTCFEAGEYMTALRHYRRAAELSDANLLNAAIGRTFQELGYPFIARRYFRDYLNGPIEDGEGREKIEKRLATVEEELETQGAEIVIESSPPDADVYVVVQDSHWEDLGRTPLKTTMLPGEHTFIVQKNGFISSTQKVSVAARMNRTVDAKLVDEDASVPIPGRDLRRAGIFTMAASIPFVVGGTALFVVGTNKRSAGREMRGGDGDDQIEAGTTLQNAGLAVGIVGVGAGVTGAVLYFIGRNADAPQTSTDEAPEEARGWSPVVAPNHVGVRLRF